MPRILTVAALFVVALVAGRTTPAVAHDGPHEMADHCVTWSVTTLVQPSYLAPDKAEVEVEVTNFCTYPVAASFCFRTRDGFNRDDIACRRSALDSSSDGGFLAPGQTWTEPHFQRRRPPRVDLQRGTAVYWWQSACRVSEDDHWTDLDAFCILETNEGFTPDGTHKPATLVFRGKADHREQIPPTTTKRIPPLR